jgi:hypothetical protein
MEFRLLGPLEVVERDRLLALGGVKQRSLLAAPAETYTRFGWSLTGGAT